MMMHINYAVEIPVLFQDLFMVALRKYFIGCGTFQLTLKIFRSREQANLVRQGCSILIGTPGRVNDFKNRFVYLLDEVEFFILDEADKLLEMSKFFFSFDK